MLCPFFLIFFFCSDNVAKYCICLRGGGGGCKAPGCIVVLEIDVACILGELESQRSFEFEVLLNEKLVSLVLC